MPQDAITVADMLTIQLQDGHAWLPSPVWGRLEEQYDKEQRPTGRYTLESGGSKITTYLTTNTITRIIENKPSFIGKDVVIGGKSEKTGSYLKEGQHNNIYFAMGKFATIEICGAGEGWNDLDMDMSNTHLDNRSGLFQSRELPMPAKAERKAQEAPQKATGGGGGTRGDTGPQHSSQHPVTEAEAKYECDQIFEMANYFANKTINLDQIGAEWQQGLSGCCIIEGCKRNLWKYFKPDTQTPTKPAQGGSNVPLDDDGEPLF